MTNRYSALHFNTAVRPITLQATTPQHTSKTNNQTINFGDSGKKSRRDFLIEASLGTAGFLLPSYLKSKTPVSETKAVSKEKLSNPPPIVIEIMKRPALMDMLIERAKAQTILGVGYVPAHKLPTLGFDLSGGNRVGWFVSWDQIIDEYNEMYPNQALNNFDNQARYAATEWIGLLCADDVIDQGIDLKREIDKVPKEVLTQLNNARRGAIQLSNDLRDGLYEQIPQGVRQEIEELADRVKNEIKRKLIEMLDTSQLGQLAGRVDLSRIQTAINTINIEPEDFIVEFLRASTDCDLKKLRDISSQYVSTTDEEFEITNYDELSRQKQSQFIRTAKIRQKQFELPDPDESKIINVLFANNKATGYLMYQSMGSGRTSISMIRNFTVNEMTGNPLPGVDKVSGVGTALMKNFIQSNNFDDNHVISISADEYALKFWKAMGFYVPKDNVDLGSVISMKSTVGKIKAALKK